MKDPILFKLFKNFVFEIYPLLDPALEKKIIQPKYDKYPSLKYKSNGMPEFSLYNPNSPYKINDLFRGWGGKCDIQLKNFESYLELENYLLNHKEHILSTFPETFEKSEKYSFLLISVIEEILERYYLLNISKTENEILLTEIYTPFENYIYAENLHFDIAIPILFIGFDQDEFQINEDIIVRKIKDEHQIARYDIKSYTPAITDAIISSATHEVVFKNYFLKKGNKFFDNRLADEKAFPLERFEMFFNSIKVTTNINSGFAQILVYPHNWVDFYKSDMATVKGLSLKKYPNYFDDYFWNNDTFPIINKDEGVKIAKVYNNLLKNENNKIQIANRRLRLSYLRDNDEDSILDIIIALETLLSDNDKGELTHKLALRTAKLLSYHNSNYNALQIFNAVKKIYDFRSAVVHGSSKIDSKREIKLHSEAEPIKTISLANDYLREVLGILVENPIYLDSKEIDKLLLE